MASKKSASGPLKAVAFLCLMLIVFLIVIPFWLPWLYDTIVANLDYLMFVVTIVGFLFGIFLLIEIKKFRTFGTYIFALFLIVLISSTAVAKPPKPPPQPVPKYPFEYYYQCNFYDNCTWQNYTNYTWIYDNHNDTWYAINETNYNYNYTWNKWVYDYRIYKNRYIYNNWSYNYINCTWYYDNKTVQKFYYDWENHTYVWENMTYDYETNTWVYNYYYYDDDGGGGPVEDGELNWNINIHLDNNDYKIDALMLLNFAVIILLFAAIIAGAMKIRRSRD